MPPFRSALAASLAALGVLAAPAAARVALVATGSGDVTVVDLERGAVRLQVPVGGVATRVATSPDGSRGFAGAGGAVAAFGLDEDPVARIAGALVGGDTAQPTGEAVQRSAELGGPVTGLAVSPGGGTVWATAGTRLVVLDARDLRVVRSVALGKPALGLARSRDGGLLAIPLTGGRVAFVTAPGRVLRRVRVPGAVSVAFDDAGRAWVTGSKRRLFVVADGKREKHPLTLGRGVGPALAASPDGARIAVGAGPGGHTAALLDVASKTLHGLRSGAGPSTPAWSSDGVRVYLADAGAAGLSLVSPFTRARIGTLALPGARPVAVAVQGGRARTIGGDGADAIGGSRLPDLLESLGGDDRLGGGRENDRLLGGPGNDVLDGGSYDDLLDGGDGDDRLLGGSGNDRILGGAGADTANGGTGDDHIHGSTGDDVLDGGPGDDRIYGEEGNDRIVETTFGNDRRLFGGPGDDYIDGGRGSDLIKGGDGNDTLKGGTGTEDITGGDGDDAIEGGAARDLLYGNNGRDVVRGDSGNDTVEGGEGADQLDGGSGADELDGGPGADQLTGGPGPDLIVAGDGDDTIRAADDSSDEVDCGDGSDTVYVEADAPQRDRLVDCETVTPIPAEAATDADTRSIISGTDGPDVLHGTPGDDSLFGKNDADRLFGAGGDDYVDGENGADELHGGPGNDTLAGRSGDDRIFGDAGDDRITGDRGSDHIAGGAGNDTIFGNLAPDVISGGSGDDRINVVRGELDTVRCGSGHDTVLADPGDTVARDCEDVRR